LLLTTLVGSQFVLDLLNVAVEQAVDIFFVLNAHFVAAFTTLVLVAYSQHKEMNDPFVEVRARPMDNFPCL